MAVRCLHEASLYEGSSFVTLTYDPARLQWWSLRYKDFQDFMKRLRFHLGGTRFFMCGEYMKNGMPHFHALLFGREFSDRKPLKTLGTGDVLYSSDTLESLWGHGFCSIGSVTLNSAQYVARYAQKSLIPGDENWKRRDVTRHAVDGETGECWLQVPEFIRMSLKPGIGADWFKQYHRDVFGSQSEPTLDRVVVEGKKMKPPKYYDVLLGRQDEYRLEYVKFAREMESLRRGDSDATPARLLQREAVARARLKLKSRGL